MALTSRRRRSSTAPEFVGLLLDNPATFLLARICVTLPFLAAGLFKLLDWQGGEAEMIQVGLYPPWLFNLAALATELGGSVLVILNRRLWLGAGALGVFTVFTALLAHRFWELEGEARAEQLNAFLSHATICAALILVTVVSLRNSRRA
jgi:transmembrane protein